METFKISNVYLNYSRVIKKKNPMNSENKEKSRGQWSRIVDTAWTKIILCKNCVNFKNNLLKMPKYVNRILKKCRSTFFEHNIDKPKHNTFRRLVCTEVLEAKFTL